MSTPEELAHEKIDKLLTECGWIIQNRSTINLSAGRGIAVREALLKGGDEADYLLVCRWQGNRHRRSKAGRSHTRRCGRAIGQICERLARHLSQVARPAPVRLR